MLAGLWLLVFGIIFLVLSYKTVRKFWFYYKDREVKHLKSVTAIWAIPVSFILVIISLSWTLSLTSVDREKIIGSYSVDDRFYPGKNAAWQKKHYRFEIRSDDTFVLFERLGDGSEKPYFGKVSWANEATEKWSVTMDAPHHVIDKHPVLYRERFGFYYVFRTKYFGNMFYRKVDGSGS
jgi:hypothetical protein